VSQRGAAALDRPVRDEMSAPVETCAPDDEVREVMERMTDRRIRHLPVVDGTRVIGVVSIGDVVKHRVLEVQNEAAVLQDALTIQWASSPAA
jgi:predicted transcriptional regulator